MLINDNDNDSDKYVVFYALLVKPLLDKLIDIAAQKRLY